eukprot:gnl/Spiro4/18005_TR9609_c0_g1_i1.p1 gnl/Spiro4/18005_TR9609_c0_g1~~gnl/Spiro4/18005_TR9609_c0_g1_i1.p1  ORF type:complete len:392 (+),score=113.21 gnl/Spiro4/18005_TR9609_c0_g1_i1:109-1284(+)
MGCGASGSRPIVGTEKLPPSAPAPRLAPILQSKGVEYSDINQEFLFVELIGKGAFATVRKAFGRIDKLPYAVKIVNRTVKLDKVLLAREVEIMMSLNHPHIVRCYRCFESPSKVCLVMELMEGGELFDRIIEKEFYSEREASFLIKGVLEALSYLHSRDVVHRDLKPENLLFDKKGDTGVLKIADFGFAKCVERTDMAKTACGSPTYAAPEVLRLPNEQTGYTTKADIWSLGVILYILLCGYPPFPADNVNYDELFKLIRAGSYSFNLPEWDGISSSAKDLIKNMMCVDDTKRFSADQCLNHAWIAQTDMTDNARHLGVAQQGLMRGRSKWKRAINGVLATLRFSHISLPDLPPAAEAESEASLPKLSRTPQTLSSVEFSSLHPPDNERSL